MRINENGKYRLKFKHKDFICKQLAIFRPHRQVAEALLSQFPEIPLFLDQLVSRVRYPQRARGADAIWREPEESARSEERKGSPMEELGLEGRVERKLQRFVERLDQTYGEDLISVILYGSAASGEFVKRQSDVNLLIVLKDTKPETLRRAALLVNKARFGMISPLLLTEEYIGHSLDIFPIEFLDMTENHKVLRGKDVLANLDIDPKNLRNQCERELKEKLITLRQAYIRIHKSKRLLKNLLLRSSTSILHISRNLLRVKGQRPPYRKPEVLEQLSTEFGIKRDVWEKIWLARMRRAVLTRPEIEPLFLAFVEEVERLVSLVDKL